MLRFMSLCEQECEVLVPEDVFLSKEQYVPYFPVLPDSITHKHCPELLKPLPSETAKLCLLKISV